MLFQKHSKMTPCYIAETNKWDTPHEAQPEAHAHAEAHTNAEARVQAEARAHAGDLNAVFISIESLHEPRILLHHKLPAHIPSGLGSGFILKLPASIPSHVEDL